MFGWGDAKHVSKWQATQEQCTNKILLPSYLISLLRATIYGRVPTRACSGKNRRFTLSFVRVRITRRYGSAPRHISLPASLPEVNSPAFGVVMACAHCKTSQTFDTSDRRNSIWRLSRTWFFQALNRSFPTPSTWMWGRKYVLKRRTTIDFDA
jgi:hypothetical protein